MSGKPEVMHWSVEPGNHSESWPETKAQRGNSNCLTWGFTPRALLREGDQKRSYRLWQNEPAEGLILIQQQSQGRRFPGRVFSRGRVERRCLAARQDGLAARQDVSRDLAPQFLQPCNQFDEESRYNQSDNIYSDPVPVNRCGCKSQDS